VSHLLDCLLAVAALVAVLDYFGIKPKKPVWGLAMPLSRNWKLVIMLVLVAASLGMSGYGIYRSLRPKIVGRIVEKDRPVPVAVPCPPEPAKEIHKTTGVQNKFTPVPGMNYGFVGAHGKTEIKNSRVIGSNVGIDLSPSKEAKVEGTEVIGPLPPITQGPCSNAQIGGSNNQATTNCGHSSVITIYSYDGSQKKVISGGTISPYFDGPNPTYLAIQEQLKANRESEALSTAQMLIADEPYWATPHILAGIAYVNLGNLNAAKSELKKARLLTPPGYEFEYDYAPHLQHLEEVIKTHEH
jgi:hypothetical protein